MGVGSTILKRKDTKKYEKALFFSNARIHILFDNTFREARGEKKDGSCRNSQRVPVTLPSDRCAFHSAQHPLWKEPAGGGSWRARPDS